MSSFAPQADYRAYVAWDRSAQGYFRIGSSKIGGPDGLAPVAFSDVFGGSFDEIGVVERISISGRGRDNRLGPVQATTGSIQLRDDTGLYNALNAASPLAGKIKPLRPIRIEGTFLGVTTPLFFGFLRDGDGQPRGRTGEITFELIDALVWLDAIKLDNGIPAPTTVGGRIGDLLTLAGWTDPAMRSLDVGHAIPARPSSGKASVTAQIRELLEVDLGVFFFDRAGVATYRGHNAWVTTPFSGRIEDGMAVLAGGFTIDNVFNRVSVTRQGGVEQIYEDTVSSDEYTTRDANEITSDLLASDDQAAQLAHAIVAAGKDPQTPVWSLKIRNSTDTLLQHALTRDFGDWIQAAETVTGTDGDWLFEQVTHEINAQTKAHQAAYLLSRRPATVPLKIGRGKIGQDVLAY